MTRFVQLLALLVATSIISPGQTADPNPRSESVAVPTVTFTLSWEKGDPKWYSVAIQSTGPASYRSTPGNVEGGLPSDPFMVEFTASEDTRRKVFEWAKDANYFKGDFDFKKGRIAQTGTKTLVYQEGDKRSQASFNWSKDQSIQKLANLFQGISITMESGRRLEHLYRFEKLGLDRELKRMEDLQRSGELPEVQALQPILKRIADDRTVVNIGRQRALRLMGMSDSPARSVVNGH